MLVEFEKACGDSIPKIIVRAAEQNDEVDLLIKKISKLISDSPKIIPVKTAERILMVKTEDLALVEVMGDRLTFFFKDKKVQSTGHLNKLMKQINNYEFIQVSRHAVININHLESLELSFGGALMAKLTMGRKTSVSRKYIKEIESRLGI